MTRYLVFENNSYNHQVINDLLLYIIRTGLEIYSIFKINEFLVLIMIWFINKYKTNE